ncbi:F0F1 ATP synthase subunit B family protein [Burkholderia pseudomallei]|uniref:F0F1 ATP synthase subunit B family protein n=2 Tax=Burkholderia pseudomallei TaxID=28450 RepID=UPI0003C0A980|nr:ATP synthase delta (OSCP) subunit [Burkholderia pseudomallei]AGZ31045.1 ATP synthase delta (OSCP) subunit [Burkholderia pseudomallei NCTC 13179]KGS29388.1 ATP synthase delta (OSCP) subunit [Burkholderia pseudomallei MSHR7343]KGS72635.1 ATP synthase delta (OSCP) subunit [Burkholderia pseudomallei MSHR7334]KGV17041.1 ATP synthase delta (OSCP) subunit [Burkholderia pseudomallei MSHR4503]MBM5578654.1 F0F1 ATP synthase subunit B [Burkholderia pseudomallei]
MRIDWSTLALQTVNVVVLVWLLSRFLFRPVSDIIAKRQAAARKLIDDASRERDAAHAERERARAERASLAAARDDALKDALAQAAAGRERLIAAARADAQALRDAARAQADADAVQRAKALDARATRLAIDIAAKLLARLPDSARVAGFVDGVAASLARLPADVRASLADEDAQVRLVAPRALTAQEAAACRAAFAASVGRPLEPDVRVDPALIAGLELESKYANVRNSLRQDLATIEAALLNEDDADA